MQNSKVAFLLLNCDLFFAYENIFSAAEGYLQKKTKYYLSFRLTIKIYRRF